MIETTSLSALELPGYRIDEVLHETRGSVVYRGWSEERAEPVVLKVIRALAPGAPQRARAELAFEIGRRLEGEGVVRHLALERLGNDLVLVSEDFGGVPL